MYLIVPNFPEKDRPVRAKRPGDVVLMLQRGKIKPTDKIQDPELGLITVARFVEELEGAASTCATLELMIDEVAELRKAYKSCPPRLKTKG